MLQHTRVRLSRSLTILIMATAAITRGDDIILSDNLSEVTGGSETAQNTTTLTVSFSTDTTVKRLASAVLLIANPSQTGSAMLSLYSDAGHEPDALLATLDSPSTYPVSLGETTFTGDQVWLDANTTYWLVLEATGGEFEWAWSYSNVGLGTGFLNTWGISNDTSMTWWSINSFPVQLQIIGSTNGGPGDFDEDGDIDFADYESAELCLSGPDVSPDGSCPVGSEIDLDTDSDADLHDLATFMQLYTGTR